MDKKRTIGVFDSGVGGLTVAKLILERFPEENMVYFGDTAHIPYGSKSAEELINLADRIIALLLDEGADLVVAACNTSSSVSLPWLTQKYSVPIIGVVEPGARAAAAVTKNKKIGVIGTKATVESKSYPLAINRCDPSIVVYAEACPLFVPLVESGQLNTPAVYQAAESYLGPLLEKEIDTLVLGCTHYPYLFPVLRDVAGPNIMIVDPAVETTNELVNYIPLSGLVRSFNSHCRWCRFFSSGSALDFARVGNELLEDVWHIEATQVSIPGP